MKPLVISSSRLIETSNSGTTALLYITTAIFSAFLHLLPTVECHGRLIEPPSRASAWRYGFSTPPNYNDHELFCGGFTRQWQRNDGKCGVCGDAWDAKPPRAHEYGGRYGQGVIVRKYETSSVITIRIELTASHNGYFEFRLCPNFKNTTQECLDKNVLERSKSHDAASPNNTRYYPTEGNKIYEMRYRLPNISCEHCVLQWRYIAGNNWGTCSDGSGAVGCGPQEEFRSCADIQIGEAPLRPYVPPPKRPPFPTTTTKTTSVSTEEPEEIVHSIWIGISIAFLSLLGVLVAVILIYFYYYLGGKRITKWIKSKTSVSNKQPPPIKPPRTKKLQRELSSLSSSDITNESLA